MEGSLAILRLGVATPQRAAELHFAEPELISQAVGGLGKLLQFFTPPCLKQIELLSAVTEIAQTNS
jgi:hypothetical protein